MNEANAQEETVPLPPAPVLVGDPIQDPPTIRFYYFYASLPYGRRALFDSGIVALLLVAAYGITWLGYQLSLQLLTNIARFLGFGGVVGLLYLPLRFHYLFIQWRYEKKHPR